MPFAMVLAHHAPHSPLQAPEPLVEKYRRRLGKEASEALVVTYAMIEAMDTGLGRLFQALKEFDQWDKTVIVFTSDNGPVPQPAPRLYDLGTDPGEQRDLAAVHPEVVQKLAKNHDAWFAEVIPQWQQSRTRILDHDRAYWKDRTAPDPATLFQDFWLWKSAPKGTDLKTTDPLHVFRGFWNDGEQRP